MKLYGEYAGVWGTYHGDCEWWKPHEPAKACRAGAFCAQRTLPDAQEMAGESTPPLVDT